jgi:replicative superfamily II helicase
MPAINNLQLAAINDFHVLDGKSLMVVAPTSSGKTMIGELAAVREAEQGSRSVMLLPLRALVNDKYDYLTDLYGDHLTVVRATGEHADQVGDIYSGQYDLALLTYEKFLNMVTGSPWLLRGVGLVVVDEAQNMADPTRGPSLEFLLTLLRSGHARGGAPQVVALSAVIGDSHGLERWLDAGLLQTQERPIPLRESMIDGSGRATHLNPDGTTSTDDDFVAPVWLAGGQGSKQIVIPLVQRLVNEGKKVIVFRAIKGETVGTAGYLAASLGLTPAQSVLDLLPGRDLSESSNSLRQSLAGGVGFHNADLSAEERTALETRFRDRDSDLKVIVATTTLAMGINTPAEAVVVAGLMHPGAIPYSIAEYKNMVGRAGRLGYSEAGESYIVATGSPAPAEAWNRYILGTPEDITSHFLSQGTDPQTLILRSLVVLGGSVTESALLALLENSFAVWQRVDTGGAGWDRSALQRDLQDLVTAGLLDIEPNGSLTVTELGRFAGESGLEVRSVTQVSSLLRFTASGVPLNDVDLVVIAQATVELDSMYLPLHGRSRQEQARWPQTLAQLGAQRGLLQGLHVGGGDAVARAKRAAACMRFASATPLSQIEAELMQHLRDRSAAGPIRAVAGRTRDVIDAVATICRVRGCQMASEEEVDALAIRLELGLPADVAGLASRLGSTLTRANYLDLRAAGLLTEENVLNASSAVLEEILGLPTAEAVKAILNRQS